MNKMIRVPANQRRNSNLKLDSRRRGLCTAEELVKLILRKYGISEDELETESEKVAACETLQPVNPVPVTNRPVVDPTSVETVVFASPQSLEPAAPIFVSSTNLTPATQQMTFCWD